MIVSGTAEMDISAFIDPGPLKGIVIFDPKQDHLILSFCIDLFDQIIIKPLCKCSIITNNRLPGIDNFSKLLIQSKLFIYLVMKMCIIYTIAGIYKPVISSFSSTAGS